MPLIHHPRSEVTEFGIAESVRVLGGLPNDDSPSAAVVIRGQVDGDGNFRMTIPAVSGLFRGAVIRELSAMGTASLALSGLWDDDLVLPLAAPGAMSGTPNEAFVGEVDGLSVEPFGPTAVAIVSCPIQIDVTGATPAGRFVLMVGFR